MSQPDSAINRLPVETWHQILDELLVDPIILAPAWQLDIYVSVLAHRRHFLRVQWSILRAVSKSWKSYVELHDPMNYMLYPGKLAPEAPPEQVRHLEMSGSFRASNLPEITTYCSTEILRFPVGGDSLDWETLSTTLEGYLAKVASLPRLHSFKIYQSPVDKLIPVLNGHFTRLKFLRMHVDPPVGGRVNTPFCLPNLEVLDYDYRFHFTSSPEHFDNWFLPKLHTLVVGYISEQHELEHWLQLVYKLGSQLRMLGILPLAKRRLDVPGDLWVKCPNLQVLLADFVFTRFLVSTPSAERWDATNLVEIIHTRAFSTAFGRAEFILRLRMEVIGRLERRTSLGSCHPFTLRFAGTFWVEVLDWILGLKVNCSVHWQRKGSNC